MPPRLKGRGWPHLVGQTETATAGYMTTKCAVSTQTRPTFLCFFFFLVGEEDFLLSVLSKASDDNEVFLAPAFSFYPFLSCFFFSLGVFFLLPSSLFPPFLLLSSFFRVFTGRSCITSVLVPLIHHFLCLLTFSSAMTGWRR